MKDLTVFSLREIQRKLNSINVQINLEHKEVFPKERHRLLSLYQYQRRFVNISPQGYFSFSKLATSLIDFFFVRSLVASSYDRERGPCFDPTSFFVLHLCRYLDEFKSEKTLSCVSMIKIKEDAIGLTQEYLMNGFPVRLTFLISKKELGQRSLMKSSIFSLEIVKRVDLVTGKILSYDSTLFPTFANYKGCNYAYQECRSIPLKDNFLKSLRYRVNNFLNYPEKIILGKEKRFFARCPKDDLSPSVKKRPTFRVLSFCFIPKEDDQRQSELAYVLGLEKRLLQEGLYLKLTGSLSPE